MNWLCTKSNYNKVHKGKKTDFVNLFLKTIDKKKYIFKKKLTEQGTRYINKYNQNIVIETKNKLENYVYSMESVVNDEKIKLDDEEKNKVTEKIEEIKTWLYTNSDNIAEYENKQKELEEIVQPIMEKMGAGGGMPENTEKSAADIPVNESVNEPSIEEID